MAAIHWSNIPRCVREDIYSFLSEKELLKARGVCSVWKREIEAHLSAKYEKEIQGIKNYLIKELCSVKRVCAPYRNMQTLIDTLPIFSVPSNFIEKAKEIDALKILIHDLVVHCDINIPKNMVEVRLQEVDFYKINEQVGGKLETCKIDEPFIQPQILKEHYIFREGIDPSKFWDQCYYSLCKSLPVFFPKTLFENLHEGDFVAFPLRGKIVVCKLCQGKDVEESSFSNLQYKKFYIWERDSQDLLSTNTDRKKNKELSYYKVLALSDRVYWDMKKEEKIEFDVQLEKIKAKKILIGKKENEFLFISEVQREIDKAQMEAQIDIYKFCHGFNSNDRDFFNMIAKICKVLFEKAEIIKIKMNSKWRSYRYKWILDEKLETFRSNVFYTFFSTIYNNLRQPLLKYPTWALSFLEINDIVRAYEIKIQYFKKPFNSEELVDLLSNK